jgi:uncharacterized protein YdhG (YjbR/CyaY superfamily)
MNDVRTGNRVPKTVDEYIARFPAEIRETLEDLRKTIRKAAPQADEKISYQIPAFALKGDLVHYAAYKNHIGFYPGSRAIAKFKKKLSAYEGSKGTIRFPLDQPIPFRLIKEILKYNVKENTGKVAPKRKKK